jgi:two-component system chemotaxis sensor kinase CheA
MFVQEAREHVQNLNEFLLRMEREPAEKEHVNTLFRSAHSLKGMAATMGYDQIKQLCIAIEEIFDKFRKEEQDLSSDLASALFKCFDALQEMIDDEGKKIEMESYLKLLQTPSESVVVESTDVSLQQTSQTVRVKMEDLDALVNLVGELMIDKMRLEQSLIGASDETGRVLTSLNRLISDLQYQTMKIRLVPIEQIFNRFPRMIRDLSTSLGKEVKLDIEGAGIELDRTVLDVISDPLLHILRNAIDHGIEAASEREETGKPKQATIKIAASRIGDRIAIEISDDGKGIDIERIRAKALEKKIISEAESRQMSEDEIINLLGTPGLSSASKVTEISGRGVGMDVVFRQVQSVGGNVQIKTRKGFGTTFTLVIPLSLAIISGLVIKVGNEKYVIPISSIITTINIEQSEIKTIQGRQVIKINEQVISLVKVSDVLGIKDSNNSQNDLVTVILVDKGGKQYGLIVDSYENMQEIVTKRLHSSHKSSFSDASILSDGRVVLILEPTSLI